jgi:gamma-glutamylcyclotransferase (GGCT)/AIG2-like uncharacterized protein YtfP
LKDLKEKLQSKHKTKKIKVNKELELIEEPIEEVKKPIALVCAYGTLRENHSNWRWVLKEKSDMLGTFKTAPEYTMYGKGRGFPYVVTGGDTSIEYDLFAVYNESVLERIHSLEGCTGISGHASNWYDIIDIETPHGTGKMYVMHTAQGPLQSIITSGNWNDQ